MRNYSIGIDEINRILSNQKRKNVQSTDIDSPTLKKVGGSISVEEEKTPEQQVITQKKSGFSDWLKGNKIDLKAESEQMRLKSNQNKYNNSHDEELTSDLRKWSNPEYKMTSEDKAKFKEYQKRISLGGTYGYKYADLIGEQLDNFKKVSDKVNPIASFAIGATDNAVGKTIMNIAATDEEKEELKQALSNARKQSPIPTLAGQLGTNVALYGVGSKAMQAIPAISNLTGKMGNAVGKKAGEVANLGGQYLFDKGAISAGSKILGANIGKGIANSTANILGDTILDVSLDTVPTTIENVKSGMSVGEVAKEAGKNIGTNLAFNVGGEVLGAATKNLIPELKKIENAKKISTAHTVNGNSPIPKTPETSMGEGYSSDLSISNPQNDVNSIAKEVSKKFDINNYPDATGAYKSAKKNIHNMFNMFGNREQEQAVMNVVNEFVENPSIEKYIEVQNLLKNEADKLVGTEYSYRGDKARKIGKTRKFDEEYDYMSAYDSINELYNSVRDRAKSNVNKVMAEDIGLGKESISIPVSEDGTVGKVSKSRTNTLENSGINTSDELANKYLNENNFKYEDISEKETMSIAKSRIDDGIDKWKNKLMSQDEFTASDIDTMMMIYSDTVNRARQSGDEELWKEAGTIFKKIQESGTKSGQSIQAFAKWSRNTPEGIVSDTFRDISKKVKKQVGEKKADEIIGQLTVDLQKDIYELAEKAFTSGLDSREGKESFAEIGKIVNKNTPKTLKGVVKSYLMDSMLLNFRTLISRNAGGNLGYNAMEFIRQPISAGIDTAVSKVTGARTRTGWSKDKITSALSGLAKGVSDEAKDFKKGIHTAKSGQNSITDAIYANSHPFKGNNIITKSLNKIDDLTKHGLSIGDRPFYESAYKQRIVELNDLRKKGLLSEDIMKLSDDDFNVMAELSAKLDGLTATYQDDGAMGKALESIKKAVGDLSIGTVGTDILSQFVMPFTKTPGNIITRSLEYSPYGAVKNAIITADELRKGNFNQQRFVDETGRNLMGAGLFGLGIAAYDKGFINGGYSDDKDMANAQKQSGMQEYALNTGAGNFDISWLPVIGNDLVAAAAFKEAADNSDDVPNAIWEGAKTGLNTLVNTSTLQGMNRMFGGNSSYNSDMDLFGNIGESITSGFGQAIPSLLRQATQSADPYQRNISSGDREYWQNNLMSSLPVLRQKLQPKVDNEGNIMMNNQGRDLGSRIVENMISPGKYTELQDSVVNNEAMRLFESTGNEYAFLPTANRNDIKNGDVSATDEQFFNYQVSLGKKNSEVAQTLIESEFYNTLSDEEKESALSDVYKAMKVVAKEEFVDGYSSDNKIASAYKTNGTKGVIDYMQKQHELKSRGLKDTDKTSAIYEERGLEGLDEYAEYTSVLKNADVSTSKAYENIYKDKGVDALETAVDIVKRAGGSSVKNVMPVLKNSNMTVSEKGEYLQYFVGDLPKGATEAKNTFGYSGVYNYYLHKNSADSDRNGSVSAKEVESYLRNIQMAENMRAQWFDILTNVKKNPFK